MVIRRAQQQDMERINELLMQVCLVHHRGRPDLFQYGQKKYTDAQLAEIIQDDNRPVLWQWMRRIRFLDMPFAFSSSF